MLESTPKRPPERLITDRQKTDLLTAIEEVASRKGFDYENGDGYEKKVPYDLVPKVVRELFPSSIDPAQNTTYLIDVIRHARNSVLVTHGLIASVTFVQVHTGGPHVSNTHSVTYELSRNDADELAAERYFMSTTYDELRMRKILAELADLSLEEIFEKGDRAYKETRQIKIDEQSLGITRVSEIEADQLIGFIKGL